METGYILRIGDMAADVEPFTFKVGSKEAGFDTALTKALAGAKRVGTIILTGTL